MVHLRAIGCFFVSFGVQIFANLVYLSVVLITMIVRSVLERRDVGMEVHEATLAASTVVLLRNWVGNCILLNLLFRLSDLVSRYGFCDIMLWTIMPVS